MGSWFSSSKSNNTPTEKAVSFDENSIDRPAIEFSKPALDFGTAKNGCSVKQAVFEEVEIKNTTDKKIRWQWEPVVPANCQLSFTPKKGALDKGKVQKVKVKFLMLQKGNFNFQATLKIATGESYFITVRVSGEKGGVFGVDPATLDQDQDSDSGLTVPKCLIELKKQLMSMNGIDHEGVFRLPGEVSEITRLKQVYNAKDYTNNSTNDINAVASLIKIWFRELPVPILNSVPTDEMMSCNDVESALSSYEKIPEPQKTLFSWLLDFLAKIARNSDRNKMTAQNLAIVVAPNLYDISTPNPMEGLILSQKAAAFFNFILTTQLKGGLKHED